MPKEKLEKMLKAREEQIAQLEQSRSELNEEQRAKIDEAIEQIREEATEIEEALTAPEEESAKEPEADAKPAKEPEADAERASQAVSPQARTLVVQTGSVSARDQLTKSPELARFRDAITSMARATGTTASMSAVIPTQLANEVIFAADNHGNLYPRFRKMNVAFGLSIPIGSKITAVRHAEGSALSGQAITANTSVVFAQKELIVPLELSLAAQAATPQEFIDIFVNLMATAIANTVETEAIKGNGTTEALGVITDPRVTKSVSVAAAALTKSSTWRSLVGQLKGAPVAPALALTAGTWAQIYGAEDSNGQPITKDVRLPSGELVYRINGLPYDVVIVDDDSLPNFDGASANDVFAILGDWNQYVVNFNREYTVESGYNPTNGSYFRHGIVVNDGKVADATNFVLIKKSA